LYKRLLVFHVVKQVIITVLRVIVNLCCRLFHFMMLFLLFFRKKTWFVALQDVPQFSLKKK